MDNEIKLLFAGTVGVGKTTAISAISDKAPVSTDVTATDDVGLIKAKTTVALDYSSLTLSDGSRVGLYGTPGQGRFDYMWGILASGALGLILLIDASSQTAEQDIDAYVNGFRELFTRSAVVVGINKIEQGADISRFQECFESKNITVPMMSVDVRKAGDVEMLLQLLLANIEFAITD